MLATPFLMSPILYFQIAAVASRRATNLATHLPNLATHLPSYFFYTRKFSHQILLEANRNLLFLELH